MPGAGATMVVPLTEADAEFKDVAVQFSKTCTKQITKVCILWPTTLQ